MERKGLMKYKGIVFDCDGTLADTMTAHMKAYEYVFNRFHIPFSPDEFNRYAGYGNKVMLNKLIVEKGYDVKPKLISEAKIEVLPLFLREPYVVPNTGLIDLIRNELYGNMKLAVASNGRRTNIHNILKTLGIIDYLDVIITADDCELLKPNPAPYLMTCAYMGLSPTSCLAVEDSEIGAESARTAGLDVIMVDEFNVYQEGRNRE